MKKLLVCKLATVLFGVLAVGVFSRSELVLLHLRYGDLLGASLALVSAIFGTQWVEYQKRMDTGPPSLPTHAPVVSQVD